MVPITHMCVFFVWVFFFSWLKSRKASQVVLVVKNLTDNAGAAGDLSLIPQQGRFPGGGHGNTLQYSCLENPMDRGAWRAIIHGVAKSQTWLKWLSTHEACKNLLSWLGIEPMPPTLEVQSQPLDHQGSPTWYILYMTPWEMLSMGIPRPGTRSAMLSLVHTHTGVCVCVCVCVSLRKGTIYKQCHCLVSYFSLAARKLRVKSSAPL